MRGVTSLRTVPLARIYPPAALPPLFPPEFAFSVRDNPQFSPRACLHTSLWCSLSPEGGGSDDRDDISPSSPPSSNSFFPAGLPSRFPLEFTFPDYDEAELLKILLDMIANDMPPIYRLENAKHARIAAKRLARMAGTPGFGNARAVRN